MKSTARLLFFTVLMSMITICIHAQEKVYFTADAPETVVAGKTFRIAYSLNAEVESDVEPYLSETKGFVVLMGPTRSQSSSVEITNGARTKKSTTTYTYTFQVNVTGDYTIPCCELKTKKGAYQSNPLPIRVLSNGNK